MRARRERAQRAIYLRDVDANPEALSERVVDGVLAGNKGLGFQEVRMQIIVNMPDDVFKTPKTPEEIERDLRQGAVMIWLERDEITAEQAAVVTGEQALRGGETLMDVLLSMPNVGEDADFERPVAVGTALTPVVEAESCEDGTGPT